MQHWILNKLFLLSKYVVYKFVQNVLIILIVLNANQENFYPGINANINTNKDYLII